MARRSPSEIGRSNPLSNISRRLIACISPAERAELDQFLATCQSLSDFWTRAPRAEWLLQTLKLSKRADVKRQPTERELRLFACWCGEHTGGADPWVKLAVRGVLKPVFFKQRSGELFGAALAGSVHGAVREVSHLRAQAYAAVDDPLEGAIGAAHSLATYLGAQPFPEPVALFVTTRKPIPGYRDPLSEVGKIELDPAGAAAAEQTIADAVRHYLGNPFAGTPPTVTAAEVDHILAIAPEKPAAPKEAPSKQQTVAIRRRRTTKRRPTTGRREGSILLAENNDWACEEVILSRAGRRTFRVRWTYYGYDSGRREQCTPFRSGPIRSPEEFFEVMADLKVAVSDRWDLEQHFDNAVSRVRRLDLLFGKQVEAAWRAVTAKEAEEGLLEDIEFALGRVLEFGGGAPEQWGITRDLRVAPLPLEPALSLAELERRSGKAAGVDGTPPNEWMQIVREWIESGTAVSQSEV